MTVAWFRRSTAEAAKAASPLPPLNAGPIGMVRPAMVYTAAVETVLGMGPAELWRTQPYLRTVVNFMARNVAQLGVHTFLRVHDTDRRRLTDHPVARLLDYPNPTTTPYELLHQLVSDLAVYDRAYWYIGKDVDAPSGYSLTRLPPEWVTGTGGGSLFAPETFYVRPTVPYAATSQTELPAEDVLYFHGWNPSDPRVGTSPVEALRQILAEQIHAAIFRDQNWRRGGRASAVLTRPENAPQWSPEARERFRSEWAAQWTGDTGSRSGGTPILEDGMTLQKLGFSANEDQFVDAAKLAMNVVAAVYHIPPPMIGLLDNANYSNVREFRRMLYGDTLGPLLAQIESRLNTFLVPRLPDPAGVYVEFNVGEKLQGSFEEQNSAMQTAVGRPWMTADEARAKLNLPALGGDAAVLITPLNVSVGGQASPTDSGSQNLGSGTEAAAWTPRGAKARAHQAHEDAHAAALRKFFARQEAAVRSRLGAKADADWWDTTRWDDELRAELYGLALDVSRHVGKATLAKLDVDPSRYDVARTVDWLKDVAATDAKAINDATRQQIEAALASTDPAQGVANVFADAKTNRAAAIATVAVTRASSFGTVESVHQVAGSKATKTWLTGHNARPSHAAMDGETVPVDELFSNGQKWPGSGGDPDEVAGCNCGVEVSFAA